MSLQLLTWEKIAYSIRFGIKLIILCQHQSLSLANTRARSRIRLIQMSSNYNLFQTEIFFHIFYFLFSFDCHVLKTLNCPSLAYFDRQATKFWTRSFLAEISTFSNRERKIPNQNQRKLPVRNFIKFQIGQVTINTDHHVIEQNSYEGEKKLQTQFTGNITQWLEKLNRIMW